MEYRPTNSNAIPFLITIALSLFGGLLAAYWATQLDPAGTGGGILILPVIVCIFLLTISLLITGLIARNESYGPFLILAGILMPMAFLVLGNVLRTIIQ